MPNSPPSAGTDHLVVPSQRSVEEPRNPLRHSGKARRQGIAVAMARRRNAAGVDAAEDEFRRIYDSEHLILVPVLLCLSRNDLLYHRDGSRQLRAGPPPDQLSKGVEIECLKILKTQPVQVFL